MDNETMLVLLGFGLAVLGFGAAVPPGPNRPPWLWTLVGVAAVVIGLLVALVVLVRG